MGIKGGLGIFKQAGKQFIEDRSPMLGAAVAYYSSLSLAPLLILLLSAAAMVGEDTQRQFIDRAGEEVGPRAATAMEAIIESAREQDQAGLSAVIGIVIMIASATLVFAQLQTALNIIWHVRPKKGRGARNFLRKRVIALLMIIGIFILLIAAVVASSIIGGLIEGILGRVLNQVVSIVIFAVLFALVFKYVPDVVIGWRSVWLGAAVTAVLFAIGRAALGVYLSRASVGSAYGAAGSLLVILVWVFYAAQILFFGAEITQVVASRYGGGIQPADYAEPTGEMGTRRG